MIYRTIIFCKVDPSLVLRHIQARITESLINYQKRTFRINHFPNKKTQLKHGYSQNADQNKFTLVRMFLKIKKLRNELLLYSFICYMRTPSLNDTVILTPRK